MSAGYRASVTEKKQQVSPLGGQWQKLIATSTDTQKSISNMISYKGFLLTKKKMPLRLLPNFNKSFIVAFMQEETMVCIHICTTPTL